MKLEAQGLILKRTRRAAPLATEIAAVQFLPL